MTIISKVATNRIPAKLIKAQGIEYSATKAIPHIPEATYSREPRFMIYKTVAWRCTGKIFKV